MENSILTKTDPKQQPMNMLDSGRLISMVEERITQGENWEEKRQIMVQVNYYRGNQWIVWNPTKRMVENAPLQKDEQRITTNAIRPRVMIKLSKQTKNRIEFEVIADTNDDNRIEIAKAATSFIKYWWEQEDLDKKSANLFLTTSVKGWTALKVYFDAESGQEITPNPGEYGYEEGMPRLFQGDIKCRVCDPLSLYVDPAAEADEEVRWVVERKPRDVGYIKQRYGKEIAAEENVNYFNTYDIVPESTTSAQKKKPNMAMVDELWLHPCAEYPNGAKITVAGGQLLDYDNNAGEIPFFLFRDIPIPGSVKGDAFIKDMLPIQREINIVRSMIATHARKMGNSVWMVPLGSTVDEDELTNETGGVIWYNSANGARPDRIEPPNVPNFYDRLLANYAQDIDDLSGAREVTQGRLPSGLDTYSGLALMVEQENEKLAISANNYEQGMKRVLERVLQLMKKHYTEERIARIIGEDNQVQVVAFRGADLTGSELINIIAGSSLPEMKSAQQDKIMSLWDKGAIVRKDGSPDQDKFLRLMGMGNMSELFEQQQLDENKAKMENQTFEQLAESPQAMEYIQAQQLVKQQQAMEQAKAMVEGRMQEPPPLEAPELPFKLPEVRDFYDHEIHIFIHNSFRKSNTYDKLPPEVQQIVDAHVAEHEQALMAPILEQQQQEMMMMQQQQEQQQQEQAQQQSNIDKDRELKQQELQIKAMQANKGGSK